ncbi:hypothetical protein NBRC116583_02330 [Arenicella sp. 4NH20-0111]|uniref:hypothetical protein n=1 Tax=Arenicella sp. 4NH20-0111 TaxID=3127648 RepID=UPI00310C2C02
MDTSWTLKSYSNAKYIFEDQNDKRILFDCPLDLPDAVDNENYHIRLLEKSGVIENDTRIVRCRNRKEVVGGWLIPLLALESSEHSKSEDDHFLLVASTALSILFAKPMEYLNFETLKGSDENFLLTDLLNEDVVLFFYDASVLGNLSIDHNLPVNFISMGYVLRSQARNRDLKLSVPPISESTVYVNFYSEDVTSTDLIFEILHNNYAYQENVVLRFFLLYQVLELMSDIVLDHEYRLVSKELSKNSLSLDEIRTNIDKINKNSKLGRRINLLFRNYCDVDSELRLNLDSACNDFRDALIDDDQSKVFPENLYSVRNTVFHGYASLDPGLVEEKLEAIVQALLGITPALLSSFSLERRSKNFHQDNALDS